MFLSVFEKMKIFFKNREKTPTPTETKTSERRPGLPDFFVQHIKMRKNIPNNHTMA
jgi:hypothetical protein